MCYQLCLGMCPSLHAKGRFSLGCQLQRWIVMKIIHSLTSCSLCLLCLNWFCETLTIWKIYRKVLAVNICVANSKSYEAVEWFGNCVIYWELCHDCACVLVFWADSEPVVYVFYTFMLSDLKPEAWSESDWQLRVTVDNWTWWGKKSKCQIFPGKSSFSYLSKEQRRRDK